MSNADKCGHFKKLCICEFGISEKFRQLYLHTAVSSTPHERAQFSTRACEDLDTNVWR